MHYRGSEAGSKKAFSNEFTSACLWYLIEIVLQETKPVVMEKHDIEYRDQSIIIALFEVLDYSDSASRL